MGTLSEQQREAWDNLTRFVRLHLIEHDRSRFDALLSRIVSLRTDEKKERGAVLARLLKRCERAEQESDALAGLLVNIATTCGEHDIHVLGSHFDTFRRLLEEYSVPLPSVDQFRAEVEQQVQARLAGLNG